MIRLSVTDLDSYLYWRDSEDMEFAALLARLRGQEPPSQAMLAGRAFHKLLEESQPGEVRLASVDDFVFMFNLDQEIAVPPIRELKGERIFLTPSGPVTLVGKIDALDGLVVHDFKLTERFDAERYADSYQWRSYLTMFGSHTFVYDVFVGKYDESDIAVNDYHRLQFHAYPSMESDVQRQVAALAEIVATHVPEKIAA